MKRLRDDIRLDIAYDDQTPHGSALTGRADATIRQACWKIAEYRNTYGSAATLAQSRRLWQEAFLSGLSALYRAPNILHEECLFPAFDRVTPAALIAAPENGTPTAIPLDPAATPELASWIFDFQCGAARPASATGRMLFDQLESCGALTEQPVERDPAPDADVLFAGHATVLLTSGARIIVDPFILPRSDRYPASYQPHRVADLLPLDAALITHSHPDHFDISSLLRMGPHMRIYTPAVERESLLAVDMAARLEQLGFTNAHRVRPGAEIAIEQTKVHALPFFGEQPTTGEILHPEVRNVGCTWLCEGRSRRVFLIADSGRDHAGDVRALAAAACKRFGPVDVLFGGYRAFAMYPIHYLFSSVARFLLFVPPHDLMIRQDIMNDPDALLDTAECCGAAYVAPYAAGGAPWYWERGLGWRPKTAPGPRTDSPPDEVERAAAARCGSPEGPLASPVRVLSLHAGEWLRLNGETRIEAGPCQIWPYDPPEWLQVNVAPTLLDGSLANGARALFRALEPRLDGWRQKGQLKNFFFMRKDPGVRLRFLGTKAIAEELKELLNRLVDRGAIDVWFKTVYEPEVQRFGGAAAMDAVHNWFDADTAEWIKLDGRRVEGAALISRDAFCAAVALDLVKQTISDRGEIWDVWRQYVSSTGLTSEEAQASHAPVEELASLMLRATAAEEQALHAYESANRTLSDELLKTWREGRLCAGMRSVLAAIILFHFNRHGLDRASHAHIGWTMVRALDPALAPPLHEVEP